MPTTLEEAKAKASRTGLIASILFLASVLLFSGPILFSDDLATAISVMAGLVFLVFGMIYLSASLKDCLDYSDLKKATAARSVDDGKKVVTEGEV